MHEPLLQTEINAIDRAILDAEKSGSPTVSVPTRHARTLVESYESIDDEAIDDELEGE